MNFDTNTLKIKFSASLLFTDTDMKFEINTDDVYEDFYEEKKLFDFSDYPRVFLYC